MNLIIENNTLLNEVKVLIQNLTDEEYNEQLSLLSESTLGQHFRHLIEFYIEIKNGLKQGEVSYDKRKRDINIETNRAYAYQTIEEIQMFINSIKHDTPIDFVADYSTQKNKEEKISSSLFRELAYALEHSIHHLAIIKIGLISQGKEVSENLGVAPSTVRYRSSLVS